MTKVIKIEGQLQDGLREFATRLNLEKDRAILENVIQGIEKDPEHASREHLEKFKKDLTKVMKALSCLS